MGAMATIKYDANKVRDDEVATLGRAIHEQVTAIMKEKDTFVYVDKSMTTVNADPIEVFVQVNAHKVSDSAGLIEKISESLSTWKQQSNFAHPINLNVIPVEWHAKFGI